MPEFMFETSWMACQCIQYEAAQHYAQAELTSDMVSTQMQAHLVLAICHAFRNAPTEAVNEFREAIYLSDQCDDVLRNRIELVHGLLQLELGEHSLAIDTFETAYVQTLQSKDPDEIAFMEQQLGLAFYRIGRLGEAIELWESAEGNLERTGLTLRLAHVRVLLGLAHFSVGRFRESKSRFCESLALFETERSNEFAAYPSAGLALAQRRLEENVDVVGPLQRAVRFAEGRMHIRYEALWLQHLAEAYLANGEKELGMESYLLCADRAIQARMPSRARLAFRSVLAHIAAEGDQEDLLRYHVLYCKAEEQMELNHKQDRELSLVLLHSLRDWRMMRSAGRIEH